MTQHQSTLDDWHAALASALQARKMDAIPGILVRMALDGWGHEAEEARRLMAAPPRASLGALLGHDEEAARQLQILRTAYQRGGLRILHAVNDDLVGMAAPSALSLLLTEAVLALEEHGPGARAAAAQAAFDRAEQANEREQEATR